MKLYLMRHAEAEFGEQMDPTRKLTDTGKQQAKMMGKWLSRQTEKPEILVQSSFHRSKSTAKRVNKQLDIPLISSPALDPDSSPEATWAALRKIAANNNAKSVIAISHGPLVEKLLAMLTGTPSCSQFHFAHGAIAHFDTQAPLKERPKVTDEQKSKRSVKLREAKSGTEKSWVGGTCPVCQENSDAGFIDIDDQFPSGDDEPPAHPNCGCELETRDAAEESASSSPMLAVLHWIVTPNTVARDEDEAESVSAMVEAALELAEAALAEQSD